MDNNLDTIRLVGFDPSSILSALDNLLLSNTLPEGSEIIISVQGRDNISYLTLQRTNCHYLATVTFGGSPNTEPATAEITINETAHSFLTKDNLRRTKTLLGLAIAATGEKEFCDLKFKSQIIVNES